MAQLRPLGSVSTPTIERPGSAEIRSREWHYTGYRGFCSFMSSDNDLFILRRFGKLSARVLLALQDELGTLESELLAMDEYLGSKDFADIHNGSFRRDRGGERWFLIQQIHKKLKDYSKLICPNLLLGNILMKSDKTVLQHGQMRAKPTVPEKDIRSVQMWQHNHKNAILREETDYLQHTSDLFSIVPKLRSPLRRLIERSPSFRTSHVWRKELSDLESHDGQCEFYMSDGLIERFVTILVTTFGLLMLIVPLWILAYVHSTAVKLGVISGFVVLFLVLISFATVAKPSETLAATAA